MRARALLLFTALASACGSHLDLAGLQMGPRAASFHDHIVSMRLPNGLRVAVLPDARTNLVTVTMRYEVGGADDPLGDLGLAHYVEHVMYLVSEEGREDVALSSNATTLHDRTYFYQTALDSQVDALLATAARRLELGCSDLATPMLERERDVVIEEIKERSRSRWNMDAIQAALWGEGHPYAHSPGGTTFSDVTRETLCTFIADHYGPGSATLVITGHVDASLIDRIRDRFAKIPSRQLPVRPELPALPSGDLTLHVPGLEHPTVGLVFRAPGAGAPSRTAAEMLNGMLWRGRQYVPRTVVLGGERAGLVLAYVELDDPTKVDEAAAALRRTFAHATIGHLEPVKQSARTRFANTFDDLEMAGMTIADLAARDAPMTRYRALREIDDVRESDLEHWISAAPSRLVVLLPDSNTQNLHTIAELETDLHHFDVVRGATSEDVSPPPPPPRPVPPAVVEDRLANGLRVWYAPDPDAFSIDARVVMPFDPGTGHDLVVAYQSALLLMGGVPAGVDDAHALEWYATVGVPVLPAISRRSTTLGVAGFSLFGDWHVWNLARTVVSGAYPSAIDEHVGQRVVTPTQDPPSTIEVLRRRLGVAPPVDQVAWVSHATLDGFRARHYVPSRSTLIIAGNFDLAKMRGEVSTLFSRWHSEGTATVPPPSMPVATPGFAAIPVLHANTLEIAIAFARAPRTSPADGAARAVLTRILSERLRVVREGLGASYGVYSTSDDGIVVGDDVEPSYAAESARAILDAISHVREGDAAFVADFVNARKQVLAKALAQPLGASARARQLQQAVEAGRGLGELDAASEAIRTVDIGAVRELAARELKPERMIAVVRGTPDAMRAALAAFGATAFDTVTR